MKRRPRILIVEDEPLIALGLQDLLNSAGFEVVGMAGKLEKALKLIRLANFDAALVDANLAGVRSTPAAVALVELGLPFIVLSGYSATQLEGAFAGAAKVIQKPCTASQLTDAIRDILATAAPSQSQSP